MIESNNIKSLIGNHVAPYIYNSNVFEAGKTPIYYSGPYWDNRETEAAIDAFLNGKWIVAGEHVNKFENEFGKKFNTKHSVMVNSGSSANLVMISALKKYFNWNDEDEIIVSPTGFATTVSVIYQNRLKPVFVDIEWDTLNFDLKLIMDALTDKTRAIFLSPVLGNPPNMDIIVAICTEFKLQLILDNCDSLGSKWDGKYLNEYAVASSNSFYPAHHITTGQGGMICTDSDEIDGLMRSLVNWGRSCSCTGSANLLTNGSCGHRFDKWIDCYSGIVDHRYVYDNMGYNLFPLDMQGAIGSVQLSKFDEISERKKHAKETIETIVLNYVAKTDSVYSYRQTDVCWFGTPFICKEAGLKHRLVKHLEKYKIQARNYFAGNILMHQGYSFLDDYKKYPEANKVLDSVFFLGASPHYNNNVFNYIEDVIKKFK